MISEEARDLLRKADEIVQEALRLRVVDLLPRPWLGHADEAARLVEVCFYTTLTTEGVQRMEERELRNFVLFVVARAEEARLQPPDDEEDAEPV